MNITKSGNFDFHNIFRKCKSVFSWTQIKDFLGLKISQFGYKLRSSEHGSLCIFQKRWFSTAVGPMLAFHLSNHKNYPFVLLSQIQIRTWTEEHELFKFIQCNMHFGRSCRSSLNMSFPFIIAPHIHYQVAHDIWIWMEDLKVDDFNTTEKYLESEIESGFQTFFGLFDVQWWNHVYSNVVFQREWSRSRREFAETLTNCSFWCAFHSHFDDHNEIPVSKIQLPDFPVKIPLLWLHLKQNDIWYLAKGNDAQIQLMLWIFEDAFMWLNFDLTWNDELIIVIDTA